MPVFMKFSSEGNQCEQLRRQVVQLEEELEQCKAALKQSLMVVQESTEVAGRNAQEKWDMAPVVDRTGEEVTWQIRSWLKSLDVHEAVGTCLDAPRDVDPFVYAKELTPTLIETKLRDGSVVQKLSSAIVAGVEKLNKQKAATATELSNKFKDDAFKGEMRFASLETFYKGLPGLIGSPNMVSPVRLSLSLSLSLTITLSPASV